MDKIAVVILLVSLSMVAQGVEEVSVNKILSKETITDNDIVTVKIIVVNNMGKTINGRLTDLFPRIAIPDGEFTRDIYSADPVLGWEITLEPSEAREITYNLRFSQIPAPYTYRNFTLQPASFEVEGETYTSGRTTVFFAGTPEEGCNYNNICDAGENYGSCFPDCFSGGRDDYCDRKDDLICDPDCMEGVDLDCELGTTTVRATTVPTTLPTTIPTTLPTTTIEQQEGGGLEGYLPYLFVVVFLVVIAVVVHRSRQIKRMEQKREEEREKLGNWIEGQLRTGEDPKLLKKALEKQGADAAMVDEVMEKL